MNKRYITNEEIYNYYSDLVANRMPVPCLRLESYKQIENEICKNRNTIVKKLRRISKFRNKKKIDLSEISAITTEIRVIAENTLEKYIPFIENLGELDGLKHEFIGYILNSRAIAGNICYN
ncbi:MAG: hypothetical protein J7K26_02980 [Candidatus Aenigmarchaeota archaeon]|nr:hypothetical protein [Candidatus Aenigmarchaeota archaeon]